jgi:hypothetical protein
VQTFTELETGRVEGEVGGRGPEVQLIASAVAVVAEEEVLADVDGEAVGRVLTTRERAGATPLVTMDSEGDVA